MWKTLLASASLSLALLLLPLGSVGPFTTFGSAGFSPAHALDIEIDLGEGDDDDDANDDDDDDDDDRRGIPCRRGQRIVENAGFRRVRPRDCNGRNYRYTGRRKGDNFEIRVNSRNGRIVSVRRI